MDQSNQTELSGKATFEIFGKYNILNEENTSIVLTCDIKNNNKALIIIK